MQFGFTVNVKVIFKGFVNFRASLPDRIFTNKKVLFSMPNSIRSLILIFFISFQFRLLKSEV